MLRQLPDISDPNLLVGHATGDDAAVYRLDDEVALIQTLDFFPPIVDDPFTYGEVAVANSLSDVYTMEGKPLIAMNIVGFPVDLPKDILAEVLKGGASKAKEAGVLIVGGHTVNDQEPKYGLAVTGVVKPGKQVTNAGAKPGDVLVLTKPIGTGIITTAGKAQNVKPEVLQGAVDVMRTLNHAASDVMVRVGVNACVDITGFGLLGHLQLMVQASRVGARISVGSIPVLEGARELVAEDVAPGGTRRNLESANEVTAWYQGVDENTQLLLADAQTSGGLLMAVPAERRDQLVSELEAAGVKPVAIIGTIEERPSGGEKPISVVP